MNDMSKERTAVYTYTVTHWTHGTLTVQAKNSDQAKRIACKFYGLKASDLWCGMSCFTARRVKEA